MGFVILENSEINLLFEYTNLNVFKILIRIPLKVLPADDLFVNDFISSLESNE